MAAHSGKTDYLLLNKDVPILEFHCRRSEFNELEFFEDCWHTGRRRDLPELKDFTFRQHPRIHTPYGTNTIGRFEQNRAGADTPDFIGLISKRFTRGP